jgi:hypothetical protein
VSQLSVVQGSLSSQSTADPPHAPVEHVSFSVQASPSSHGSLLFGCVQRPAPSHASFVQRLPSSGQGLPIASYEHVAEQQSPGTVPPSSQSSPISTSPLPQIGPPQLDSGNVLTQPGGRRGDCAQSSSPFNGSESPHEIGTFTQTPLWQVPTVQTFWSLHGVPSG